MLSNFYLICLLCRTIISMAPIALPSHLFLASWGPLLSALCSTVHRIKPWFPTPASVPFVIGLPPAASLIVLCSKLTGSLLFPKSCRCPLPSGPKEQASLSFPICHSLPLFKGCLPSIPQSEIFSLNITCAWLIRVLWHLKHIDLCFIIHDSCFSSSFLDSKSFHSRAFVDLTLYLAYCLSQHPAHKEPLIISGEYNLQTKIWVYLDAEK